MGKEKKELLNEPLSSLTHLIGALLSIIALVILIITAVDKGTVWHVVGFSIFGAGLILLYSASTLFHFFNRFTRTKKVFERIDHSMIFVLIAATYTPVCLTLLRGPWGWTVFGIVWAIAIAGISLKSSGVMMGKRLSTSIYVGMGWIVIIAIYPLLKLISIEAFSWLFAGGISYTVGAVFYHLGEKIPRRRMFDLHEIFHLLVLAGSFLHFWFILKYLF